MNIIIYIFGFIFSIFALIFLYYSIQNAKLMKGSMGRQIMAFGSVLFIFAIMITIIDVFLLPAYGAFLNALIIWFGALFTFGYGMFMVGKDIQNVYRVSLLRIIWEHKGSRYNLMGIFSFTVFAIPAYIMDMENRMSGDFSWLTLFNNLVLTICFANFAFAAIIHNKIGIKPQSDHNEFISLRDEVFVIKAYSELVNTFLSAMKMVGGGFGQLLLEFFEFNPIFFEGCEINQSGSIDFSKTMDNAERLYEGNKIQNICVNFSALISKIFRLYSTMASNKLADEVLSESYRMARQNYGISPLFFDILRSLPDGVLENEKIALLPREELEASVQERTKELEESRNYINNVMENMMDMLIVVDPKGIIKTINKITEEILGYGEEELIGQPVNLIFPSGEISVFGTSQFNELFKDGLARNLETIYLSKNKRNIPVLFSGSVMKNEYDEVIGIVCVAQDITELKNAESILKESEEKHRNVFENANEGIIVIQDGKLKLVNPKAIEIIGYSENEIEPKRLIYSIHPDNRRKVLECYRESLLGKEIRLHQFRIRGKEDEIKWMEASAIKINWEGKPASLVFINDITERHKIEQELLKAQKLESIGILAGEIAHDFNNYLQGIVGNISMALSNIKLDDRAYKRLIEAGKASEQAASLTQQLLTFAKGGEPLLKLSSIVEIIQDATSLGLLGSNVKGELDINDNLWIAEVDKGQLSQVINNLVINAKQAMIDGGIIRVTAENKMLEEGNIYSLSPGPYIEISVKDQGIGIPEKNLAKIFDPFFTTKPNGNGLGLATCYSIIRKHSGDIMVESKMDVGTTFHIHLPAMPGKKLGVEKKKQEIELNGDGKILVMDDEEFIRELAFEMLVSMGYKVAFAENGNEALDKYIMAMQGNEPFDAVIMDLTIPGGMGGKEAIARLKEIDPTVKAIVSSGYSSDSMMAEFMKYGFCGILAKPYKKQDLGETLSRVMSG